MICPLNLIWVEWKKKKNWVQHFQVQQSQKAILIFSQLFSPSFDCEESHFRCNTHTFLFVAIFCSINKNGNKVFLLWLTNCCSKNRWKIDKIRIACDSATVSTKKSSKQCKQANNFYFYYYSGLCSESESNEKQRGKMMHSFNNNDNKLENVDADYRQITTAKEPSKLQNLANLFQKQEQEQQQPKIPAHHFLVVCLNNNSSSSKFRWTKSTATLA